MPNRNDCEMMKKLKTDISNEEKLNEQVKSYNAKNKIVFYAFPNVRPLNEKQQIQMTKAGDMLQITLCYWNRTSPQQETKRYPQYDFHISDHTLSDIKKCLEEIREEKSNWFNENEIASETAVTANIVKNKDEDMAEETTFQDVPLWKSDSNPWYNFNLQGKSLFVLDNDAPKIKDYNKNKKQTDKSYIHLEIPPQPYIGNPDAPVWILPMNPSYSAVDVFDLVEENDNVVTNNLDCKNDNVTIIQHKRLNDRRELIQAQYSFDFSNVKNKHCVSDFYVLDECFHTISHTGRSPKGSYDWWKTRLLDKICDGKTENLNNFFVLEPFPYHARNFAKIDPWTFSPTHGKFWKKMIQYALLNNKILLCRKYAEKVIKIADSIGRPNADTEQIFVAINSQSFWISMNNFVSYAAHENNEQEKQNFRDIILSTLTNR